MTGSFFKSGKIEKLLFPIERKNQQSCCASAQEAYFAVHYAYVGGDKAEAFDNYAFYGGLPLILSRPDDTAKMNYLKTLFSEVYLKDIVERKRIKREDVLSATLRETRRHRIFDVKRCFSL